MQDGPVQVEARTLRGQTEGAGGTLAKDGMVGLGRTGQTWWLKEVEGKCHPDQHEALWGAVLRRGDGVYFTQ